MIAKRKSALVEIFDRRTGEEFQHVAAVLTADGRYKMKVKNLTTGQTGEKVDRSPRFALYDALLVVGCPRDAATKAARNYPEW
jgi:hypothetical protein